MLVDVFFELFDTIVFNIKINDQSIISISGGNSGVVTVWVYSCFVVVAWVPPFANWCFVIEFAREFPKVVEGMFGGFGLGSWLKKFGLEYGGFLLFLF